MSNAYYNEIDSYAASWLRNLISSGVIAPGDVDERDIRDVRPSDLIGYTQCHFFAGIGVWSYALRLAGWPDDRPVWTGSCPCQPFSAAGKGGGFDDERHLWPDWFWHIGERRPDAVFGEQVASKDGYSWLDLVQADLEGLGYAWGPHVSPSAGFGAPHERHRIRFAAVADAARCGEWSGFGELAYPLLTGRPERRAVAGNGQATWRGAVGGMDHHHHPGLEGYAGYGDDPTGRPQSARSVAEAGSDGGMADADGRDASTGGLQRSGEHGLVEALSRSGSLAHPDGRERGGLPNGEGRQLDRPSSGRQQGYGLAAAGGEYGRPSPVNGFWRDADWLFCRDGKWRPVESGSFPLAHGAPARMGRLRAYGNAVDADATAHFIAAFLESERTGHTAHLGRRVMDADLEDLLG